LHSDWRELLSGGEVLTPENDYRAETRHGIVDDAPRLRDRAQAFVPQRGRWMTSRNWSGVVIAASHGCPIQTLTARWTVPEPSVPADVSAANPPPGKHLQMSVWIGLDGWRRSSLSLPQIGTVSAMEWRQGEYYRDTYLFAQWWVRNKNYGEVRIKNFRAEPGDEMRVSLTAVGAYHVVLSARNISKPREPLFTAVWYPGKVASGQIGWPDLSAPVEGRHAIWCVERPTIFPRPPQGPVLYRLPAFNDVTITGARAGAWSDKHLPIAVQRDLTAARLVRMVEGPEDGRQGGLRWLTAPDPAAIRPTAVTVSRV
jgi:hypothetical protein